MGMLSFGAQRQKINTDAFTRQRPDLAPTGPQGDTYALPQPAGWQDKLALFGATLRDVGSGLAGQQGGAIDSLQKLRQSRLSFGRQQQALANLGQTITDPQESAVFKADPETWLKIYGERAKPQTLSEGEGLFVNGQKVASQGKTGIDGGYGYSQGPDGQVAWNGAPRPMSYGEQTASAGQQETARYNRDQSTIARGRLGVDEGQLTLNQRIYEARLKSGGYGTPGVGAVIGTSLPNGWTEVK